MSAEQKFIRAMACDMAVIAAVAFALGLSAGLAVMGVFS